MKRIMFKTCDNGAVTTSVTSNIKVFMSAIQIYLSLSFMS
jgi:hypothetical protein